MKHVLAQVTMCALVDFASKYTCLLDQENGTFEDVESPKQTEHFMFENSQCDTILEDARLTHAYAVRPLLQVCTYLHTDSYAWDRHIRFIDASSSTQDVVKEPSGSDTIVLVQLGQGCRSRRCAYVDGCINGDVAAALVLLTLRLGARTVSYSQLRIGR